MNPNYKKKFGDTKRVIIRSRKSKDRHYNDYKNKYKNERTNNDLQNITQETLD